MVRDEHLKGIGIIELSAYAPTEEAQATTDVTIQVNGKDLEGFNPDVTDYHLEYEGDRPIVSAQGKNGTAVTVVDAKSANASVLVKVVSEDGKLEKVYQLLSPQKHLQAQPFLKKGLRIWFIPSQSW